MVDNSGNAVQAVTWTVEDGVQIDADVGAGRVPVIFAEGAKEIRVLGGTQSDTLNVVSTLPADIEGRVTDHRVELSAGAVVLEYADNAQFRDYDRALSFDALATGSASYSEDGFTLAPLTSGSLARSDAVSAAARFTAGQSGRLTVAGALF